MIEWNGDQAGYAGSEPYSSSALGLCRVFTQPGSFATESGSMCVTTSRSADRPPPAAVFYYSRDRAGEHPQAQLANYTGIFQADAYSGYGKLYESAARLARSWKRPVGSYIAAAAVADRKAG